ncbi:MAG: tRNA (guanosine(46)-N7)-methyltransferase TrmB [Simkaniaceae bacterium]|nr:tRNA (guanosine(46)-N7)-methyltransferase TrmB [Simkaniaceae bacterium]
MKPKDLKFPHSWEERRPCLMEGILFVPKHFEHEMWTGPSFTGNIEFCSGNGEWIISKASQHPEVQWIAVEMDFHRARKIYSKRMNLGLNNLLVVCGMAQPFVQYYLQEGSIDRIYINFPDPWPKARHAKHRIVQAPFTAEMKRILKKEGTATLVTDDPTYHEQMKEEMGRYFIQKPWEGEDYGTSWFERLWREKGREIHYLRYTHGA